MQAANEVLNQPFHTTNAILAYCLHLAGVPWDDNNKPVYVYYSENILLKFTNGAGDPIYKGVELLKAVQDAHKKGRRGHIEYVFRRVPRLPALLKAFQEQDEQLSGGEGTLDELVQEIARQDVDSDVRIIRLACIFLKMRVEFMELWKNQIPLIMISNSGRAVKTREVFETPFGSREGDVVRTPGFKIVSLNASDETLKQLNLKE